MDFCSAISGFDEHRRFARAMACRGYKKLEWCVPRKVWDFVGGTRSFEAKVANPMIDERCVASVNGFPRRLPDTIRGTAWFKDIFSSFRFLQETPLVCFVFQVKLFPESFLKRLGEQLRWTMVSRLLSLRAEGSLNSLSLKASGRMGDAVGQCEDRQLNR